MTQRRWWHTEPGRCVIALVLAAVVIVLLGTGAMPAKALARDDPALPQASNCGPHDEMLVALAEQYQEHVVQRGRTLPDGWLMETTASESGTWTFLLTNPVTGQACLKSAGEGWMAEPSLPGKGA